MIAVLLAAVIAQPLDATYSTAGNPKNCGVVMTISHPSAWKEFDVEIPHAVKALGDLNGTAVCVIHVQRDVAIIQETEQVKTDVLRTLLFQQRVGDSYVPTFCQVLRTGEVEGLGGNPVRVIEYSGHDGQVAIHEMLFVFFHAKRLIVLRNGCTGADQATADARFQAALPTFAAMLKSASFPAVSDKTNPFVAVAIAAGVLTAVGIAWALHRRFTSSVGSRSPSGRFARRGRQR